MARDASGIARVELSVDGETLTLQNPTSSSASFAGVFTWTARTEGSHTLMLRAINARGLASAPSTLTVNVTATVAGASLTAAATASPSALTPSASAAPATLTAPPNHPTALVSTLPAATTARPDNKAPVITALNRASPNVAARKVLELNAVASDPDGEPLTFLWKIESGPNVERAGITSEGARARFIAPDRPSGLGAYVLRVTVADSHGAAATATTTVNVRAPSGLTVAGADFIDVWSADRVVQDAIGYAQAPELARPMDVTNPPAAEEAFRNGYMFWLRADYDGTSRIYALLNDHTWRAFTDTWKGGADADYECTTPPNPPRRGFGKVWCAQPGLKEKLGAGETEVGEPQVEQVFENAILLRSQDYGTTYILFNDGTWR